MAMRGILMERDPLVKPAILGYKSSIARQMQEFWEMYKNPVEKFNEEEKETKVVELKLVPKADEAGPTDESPGWLLRLNKGTIFTVCSKKQMSNFLALQLQVVNKSAKSVLLYENLQDRLFGRVVATRFEAEFRLLEVLKEFTDEELRDLEKEEEVVHNDQHHRIQGNPEGTDGELADPPSSS